MAIDLPPAGPLDPAVLAAFRQQAAAIVAQERGLTTACRIKINGLARQLGIPEDQIEPAIRSLGETAVVDAPPNPQAEKFRRRLRKDLAGKSTILGPTIEAQILAAAARKYSLDDASARQVLAEVAIELGLTRISESEAIRNLEAQIDHALGEATWLAREAWDRLRSAGAKWGIELELVDQLIDEKLAANRAARARRRFSVRMTLLGAFGAISCAALVLGILMWIRSRPNDAPAAPGSNVATTDPALDKPKTKSLPEWWNVDLSLAVGAARSKHPPVAAVYDGLVAEDPSVRGKAYRQLAELAASPQPAGLLTSVATILAGAISLEESDTASDAAVVALSDRIPAATSPLPKDPVQYDVAYWAAETLAASLQDREGAPEGRAAKTVASINRILGTSLSETDNREQHQRLLRARVSERIFAQLTSASTRQPAEVAALFKDTAHRVADGLAEDEAERLEAAFLASALPAAGSNWKPYEEAIIRLGSSDNPLNVLRLLDIYQRVTDAELVKHLADLLIVRANERPKSWSKADVARAVRKGLGAGSVAMSDRDRWELLRVQAESMLAQPPPEPNDHHQLLAQTVELAHLATMAIALAQGDAGYAVFDAGLENPPSLSATNNTGDVRRPELPPPRRNYPPLSNVAKQELERVLDLLAGHGRLKQVQRASMLRTLAMSVDRVEDLTPMQASQAAPYILGEKSDEEHAAVLQCLSELRRWKRLRLAIADQLSQSKLTDDQRRQLAGVLLETDTPPEESDPEWLQTAIVRTVVKDLEDATATSVAEVSPTAASRVFDDAADLLLEIYKTRARLLGVSTSQLTSAASPSHALQLSLVPLADSVRSLGTAEDAAQLAALTQRSVALDFLATDDLRRSAAVEQVFAQLSALRLARLRPTQATVADNLAAEIAAADSAPNVLVQMRDHEATNLRLWMLYAPPL